MLSEDNVMEFGQDSQSNNENDDSFDEVKKDEFMF